jgi:hypothetical protein
MYKTLLISVIAFSAAYAADCGRSSAPVKIQECSKAPVKTQECTKTPVKTQECSKTPVKTQECTKNRVPERSKDISGCSNDRVPERSRDNNGNGTTGNNGRGNNGGTGCTGSHGNEGYIGNNGNGDCDNGNNPDKPKTPVVVTPTVVTVTPPAPVITTQPEVVQPVVVDPTPASDPIPAPVVVDVTVADPVVVADSVVIPVITTELIDVPALCGVNSPAISVGEMAPGTILTFQYQAGAWTAWPDSEQPNMGMKNPDDWTNNLDLNCPTPSVCLRVNGVNTEIVQINTDTVNNPHTIVIPVGGEIIINMNRDTRYQNNIGDVIYSMQVVEPLPAGNG